MEVACNKLPRIGVSTKTKYFQNSFEYWYNTRFIKKADFLNRTGIM